MPVILIFNSAVLYGDQGLECMGSRCTQDAQCKNAKIVTNDGATALHLFEHEIWRLGAWYDLTVLSYRHLALSMERDGVFKKNNMSECAWIATMQRDQSHPNRLGQLLISDAIVNVMLHAWRQLTLFPDLGPPGVPPTNLFVSVSAHLCAHFLISGSVACKLTNNVP